MKIGKNKFVTIHYKLMDDAGTEIDSTIGKNPVSYVHGANLLIPGLEKALEGKSIGEKIQATIAPQDGYGEYDENLVLSISREQFDDVPLQCGMVFKTEFPNGEVAYVRIVKINGDEIIVDANHEFAGKTLFFDVEVVGIREATQDEIASNNIF